MRHLADIELGGKTALVRSDLNVPLQDGAIVDDTRIRASLPTIEAVLGKGGGCVVMSHLGRPKEGQADPALSLAPIASRLGELIGADVPLRTLDEALRPSPGEVLLLENTRFNAGEKANDPGLAERYAALGDVFVMDAFASAHRAEASTAALAAAAASCCAGLLLEKEVGALERGFASPARPLVAIVGGAKISTKLAVLGELAKKADKVVVGGGIANTFLAAMGDEVGISLCEKDMLSVCEQMVADHGDKLIIPHDVVVAESFDATSGIIRKAHEVSPSEMILDAGPETLELIEAEVSSAGTLIWNGALGVFENDAFAEGTKRLSLAIAQAEGFSLAGGGETVAASHKYGVAERIDCLSTGGGAFLEFIEGKELPGIASLK